MITHQTYECEICGEIFEDEVECAIHELRHDLADIFTSGAKFFDRDGNEIKYTNGLTGDSFCSKVEGIISPSRAVAETIDHIFYECGYNGPFETVGTDTRRVVYVEDGYDWVDADAAIGVIQKKLGEK